MTRKSFTGLFLFAVVLASSGQAMAIGTAAGTSITNQAYADYKDANGNSLDRVFSNTVTTTVSQVAGIRVEPPTASKTGVIDADVYYAAGITNDGNGTDTFDFTVVNDQGWTTTIYSDDNGDGLWDPASETTVISDTGSLAADASKKVIVVTAIPAGASGGDSSTVTLTGTSQFDNAVTDAGLYTTTVLAAVLEITKTASPTDPGPGDEITYAVTGKNIGTATALNVVATDAIPANTTYVADSMRVGPIGGDYASASPLTDANDAPDIGYYNPGSNRVELTWGDEAPYPPNGAGTGGVFYFKVKVDDGVTEGTTVENAAAATFQLESGGTTYTYESNKATATVAGEAAVTVTPGSNVASGDPGDVITYAITVGNGGNSSDVIDITYTSSAGWTWDLWYDANDDGIAGNEGDFLLTDTDGDGIVDTGSIAQGGSVAILVAATIPAGTSSGATDTLVVTGTSSVDTNVSGTTGDLTTTVTAPVLSVTKAVAPTGSQPPGTELVYTITVSNSGTGVATSVVVTDIRPTHTTYKAGSILTGASVAALTSRTDAADGDGGEYDSGSNAVVAGSSGNSLGPGGTFVIRFTVVIN